MTFQTGTTAGSLARRDLLTSIVANATSKCISAVVLNAAGTGYVAGDILTIGHAGGYHSATVEVLTIGGGGAIATVKLRNGGSFSNRVATVAINAAGTGYATNDIVRLTTGTFTEFCKVRITAQAAGVPSAIAIFETGGAYTSAPTATGGATNSDIGTGTGSGLTVNTTMTGLIGTTGIGHTGGTGTGATFDLTLTDVGWNAIQPAQNRNDYSFNGVNDEKEVILQGTVSGGDEPFIGFRTYTATSGDTRYGILMVGMDSFNPGLAFASQPNVGPNADPASNAGICLLLFDNAQNWWFNIKGRRIIAVVKAVGASITSYVSMYAGLLNPFGTQTENPYPLYLSASTRSHVRKPDAAGFFVTGLTEAFHDTTSCPMAYRRPSDGTYVTVQNVNNGAAASGENVYPIGLPASQGTSAVDKLAELGRFNVQVGGGGVSLVSGGSSTELLMPTLSSNETLLIPATVITSNGTDNTAETVPRGELDDVFWLSVTKSDASAMVAEDTLTQSGVRYRIFQNAHRAERYSYFALKEG